MKRTFIFYSVPISFIFITSGFRPATLAINSQNAITFYEVPLVCGAAPEIGCGSRLKPLFLDIEKENKIQESWSNRKGTVVAIVWNAPVPNKKEREQIIQPIFKQNTVDARLISSHAKITELMSSFQEKDKWYKGMEVDLLSIEEAGIIAESFTKFTKVEGLITDQEVALIKKDFEDYFKKELTQVRSYDNLKSDETEEKWKQDGYQIYINHIGLERAEKVSEFYHKYQNGEIESGPNGKSCCDKKGCKKACCKKQ